MQPVGKQKSSAVTVVGFGVQRHGDECAGVAEPSIIKTSLRYFNENKIASLRPRLKVAAMGDAVKSIGNGAGALSELSELHAYVLRMDRVNFKLPSHCMLVTVASHFPADFTADAHTAS
ncbi:hypothetical protein CB1_001073014 [Camelus ferus]|nr:hypothetical protein CB1_001073014 [Camelus ferus]